MILFFLAFNNSSHESGALKENRNPMGAPIVERLENNTKYLYVLLKLSGVLTGNHRPVKSTFHTLYLVWLHLYSLT